MLWKKQNNIRKVRSRGRWADFTLKLDAQIGFIKKVTFQQAFAGGEKIVMCLGERGKARVLAVELSRGMK